MQHTARLITAWEGAKFETVWGEVEMRARDHQMQTPGYVADITQPSRDTATSDARRRDDDPLV